MEESEESFDDLLRRAARTPEVSANRRSISVGTQLLGRFVIEGKLGEGGMGQVFCAFDSELRSRVALKILGVPSPRALMQLKREFRSAADIVHPNLVRLHGLFCDGIEWFFTMDLVEGVTLTSLRAKGGHVPPRQLSRIFGQLALALQALHEVGTLHGDLKPSNFLVVESDYRVVLLDFGLARPLGISCMASERAGTREYMAPEQIAGGHLTEATDWYMFGVVLYEALTGIRPNPRPLPERLVDAPKSLRELCLALLDTLPERRPPGDEVLERIGEDSSVRVTSAAPSLPPVPFVGRKRELACIGEALERVKSSGPAVVLVHGPSGIGKSALIDQFAGQARSRGTTVLAGRCRERELVGYKAIDGVIDEIQKLLEGLPAQVVSRSLPQRLTELTQLFPALRAIPAVACAVESKSDAPDQSTVRRHAIVAFRDLIDRLCDSGRLILWIDDLQWSDAESALLLSPLLVGPNPVPVLFVGSYRDDSVKPIPMLEALLGDGRPQTLEVVDLAIEPLSPAESEDLALQFLVGRGELAHARAVDIAREAAGHPLFIAELAHSDPRDPSGERTTLVNLVGARVSGLPAAARDLLGVIAIAGMPIPKRVARRALGVDPLVAERAFHLLCVSRLARSLGLGSNDLIEVHHDRIREIVAHGMAQPIVQQYHLAIGRVLVAEAGAKPEVLAEHFRGGGEPHEASRYWLAAADSAFRTLAFEHAARLYATGLEHARLEPTRLRDVRSQWAESFACAGNGTAAAEVYLQAAEDCSHDEGVELRRRAAEQLLLSGHLERGLSVIEQVLQSLQMRPTRTGRKALLSLVCGRIRVRLRGLRHVPRTEKALSDEMLLRIDTCWTVACSLGVIDFLRGADYQSEHLIRALDAGEPRRILRALTLEVSYVATPGMGSERRTTMLLNQAEMLGSGIDDPAIKGLVPLTRGVAAYLQGRISESLLCCEEAATLLAKRGVGAVWETVTAQRFVIAALFQLGQLRRLRELVPSLLADGEVRGNLYATSFFRTTYSNAAWLVGDDVAQAQHQLRHARTEWKVNGFQIPHCWLLVGETHLAFYTGDGHRARRLVEEAWPRFVASGLAKIGILRVQLWHLRAMSAVMAARQCTMGRSSARTQDLLGDARHAARRLQSERIAWSRPLAMLAHAAIDLAEGCAGSATERLKGSIASFDTFGMSLYASAARVRLGELVGGSHGKALVTDGHAALQREGVSNTNRMMELLAGGFGSG